MSVTHVVIPRTRSVTAAVGATMAAAGVLALAVGLLSDSTLPATVDVLIAGFGLTFAIALLLIAFRLVSARGGLLVDEERGRLGLGVTGERDTWWLDLDAVEGMVTVPLARPEDTTARWAIELRIKGHAAVIIAESDDRSTIISLARKLADLAGLDTEDRSHDEPAADTSSAAPARVVRVAVYRRAALQGALAFFGVSFIAVGAGMFARLEQEPVFGFLFGPLLGVLGLVLVVATLVKRFATEEIARDAQHFTHSYNLGRLRWGVRSVMATTPRWRLYVHGIRGAHLELLGDDGTLVIGSGATTRSRASIAQIASLPGRFERVG